MMLDQNVIETRQFFCEHCAFNEHGACSEASGLPIVQIVEDPSFDCPESLWPRDEMPPLLDPESQARFNDPCIYRSDDPIDKAGCNCLHKWTWACASAARGLATCKIADCRACQFYE